MKRRLSLYGLLGLIVLLGGCADDNPAAPDGRVKTPDFILEDLNGNTFQLSRHQGKVVLLHFFSPGCSVCQEEVPELNALHADYAADGLLVAGIAIGQPNPATVRGFAEALHVDYPLLLDNGQVGIGYGVIQVVPVSFLIDRDGWIVGQFDSFFSQEAFAEYIEPLL